jgi:hypothetical protein
MNDNLAFSSRPYRYLCSIKRERGDANVIVVFNKSNRNRK